MAAPKVVSGARAKLSVYDGTAYKTLGIFNSVSYNVVYGTQAVFILGRLTASEIDYTHVEPVTLQLSAWRVIGQGPHAAGNVPKIQELLTKDETRLQVIDRVGATSDGSGGTVIATITGIRPTGYGTTVTARQLTEMTISAVGILVDDESTANNEPPGSTDLP